jgi:restriction system protein
LQVPDAVQNELLPSGEPRFRNQVHWARLYLVHEGLMDRSRRGVWTLTEKGWGTRLDAGESRELFRKWVGIHAEQRKGKQSKGDDSDQPPDSPEISAPADHKATVLGIMQQLPASGFERLCQFILREAGFEEVVVTGRSGDNGIDGHGTLKINTLVSLKVLFQCKRYKDSVSSAQVRDFRGAMSGRTDKGIILTTGTFTAEAKREASRDGVPPIELIDGERLIQMLESLELGLKRIHTFEVDATFFAGFRDS